MAVGGVSLILFLIISLIVGWPIKAAEANRWGKIWRWDFLGRTEREGERIRRRKMRS